MMTGIDIFAQYYEDETERPATFFDSRESSNDRAKGGGNLCLNEIVHDGGELRDFNKNTSLEVENESL